MNKRLYMACWVSKKVIKCMEDIQLFTVGTVYNCVQYFVRLVRDNPRFIQYNPLYIHSKLKLLYKIGNYFLDTQYDHKVKIKL
mgnify:FL=1